MNDENKVVLAEKSFYKWLNSYGWELSSMDAYTGVGLPYWNSNTIRYNIRLQPFYLANAGFYSAGITRTDGFYLWSNTPAAGPSYAGYLGYDGYFVVPAWQGNYRRAADSLRCLTQ